MAPMTASVTPTLKPPRIDGKAPGISTLDSTCAGRARKARHISRRSASTDRMPTIVATAIGKNTIRLQMITFDSRPVPNQIASSGAIARTGVACAATM